MFPQVKGFRKFTGIFRGLSTMNTNWVYFFGDSVFDCGRYNVQRETPSSLLYRNRDDLFPDFRGQDLKTTFTKYDVRDLSIDGAIIEDLMQQHRGAHFGPNDVVLISIGGNDFLHGLFRDPDGSEIDEFLRQYGFVLSQIPSKKVIANVYDPFFGKTEENVFFRDSGVDLELIRRNYERLNQGIEKLALRYGTLLDIKSHFLTGTPSWFEQTIEPSLRGASEIRRVVWDTLVKIGALGEGKKKTS
jgi:acyl-CoA thioesterase I